MIKVIVDTNGLMMPFQFGINLDYELQRLLGKYEIIVPSCVIEELKRINRWEAKAALQLAEKFKKIDTEKKGDEGIIEIAEKTRGYVLTNDRELRKKLRERGIKTIYLRALKYLEMDG